MRNWISVDGNRTTWNDLGHRLNVHLSYLGAAEYCFLTAEKRTCAEANDSHVLSPHMMLEHEK